MCRLRTRSFPLYIRLSLVILTFSLVSCGSTASPASGSASTTIGTNATAKVSQGLKPAYNYDRSQSIAGLFVDLHGFTCTEGPFESNLTLATDQLSYDAGSAQIISNYLQLLTYHAYDWIPPKPPQELQWMSGSTTCEGDFAFTNTLSTAVEIQSFGLQLTMVPKANSYNYRRVVAATAPCIGCGAVTPCAYKVSLPLDGGQVGSSFNGSMTSDDSTGCPLPLLIPAKGLELVIVMAQDAQTRDMLYTGTPIVGVKTASGTQTIKLSSLTSSFYFTHTDKLPCYQFHQSVFVPCP